MTINADVQTLEPGALFTFFVLDASIFGGGVIHFHGMNDGPLYWQGQMYSPWPITATGFSRTSDQQPVPKLMVGNIDGSISLLCMTYEDLLGATLIRRRTFKRYLDAANFPDGNPTANPTEEYTPEVWFIERKSSETREAVEFELSSALDFQGVRLPRRQIIANQCSFKYRGPYCNYTGPAVADVLDNPTSDPALDDCGHKLSSCKLRIWPDSILNFGGVPAAGLIR